MLDKGRQVIHATVVLDQGEHLLRRHGMIAAGWRDRHHA
jgi:hypothetical protein